MDEDLRRERLRAMGVVMWQPRGATRARSSPGSSVAARSPTAATHSDRGVDEDASVSIHNRDARAAPSVVSTQPLLDAAAASPAVRSEERVFDLDLELAVDLAQLRAQVSVCTRCELHRSRTQTVFGVGNESARLLVIGEAPGVDEDAQGEPFVGRAGKLLNAMLMAIGLAREQVYIANILKCRPPRNRDPHADEVASCGHYLQQQIAFVAPELILAVGRIAAQNLLGVTTSIGKLRGHTHTHPVSGIPVLVTYHPAYLLRSPVEKRRAWQDLKAVAARLGLAP